MDTSSPQKIELVFYQTESGNEPVRSIGARSDSISCGSSMDGPSECRWCDRWEKDYSRSAQT